MSDNFSEEKKKRKRQKKLLCDIRAQVEFYFSDANLRKDRFLSKEIQKSKQGYVPLDIITSFNKMRALTLDIALILKAIKKSDVVEVNDLGTAIKRTNPPQEPKYDPDDCTVYVECLPKEADHDWIRKTFEYCGKVVYVSLPRYRSTGDIKGFAFVEYESPDEAKRACKILNNPPDEVGPPGIFPKTKKGKYIHTQENTAPQELLQGQKDLLPTNLTDLTLEGIKKDMKEEEIKEENSSNQPEKDKKAKKRKRKNTGSKDSIDEETENPPPNEDKDEKKQVTKRKLDSTPKEDVPEDAEKQSRRKRLKSEETSGDRDSLTVTNSKKKDLPDTKGHSIAGESSQEGVEKSEDEDAKPIAEKKTRKRKLTGELKTKSAKKKRTKSQVDEKEVAKEDKENTGEAGEAQEDADEDSKKKKKKRLRLKKAKEEPQLFLRVISKSDWLGLKHEYLMIQKQCMQKTKDALRRQARMELDAMPNEMGISKCKSVAPEFIEGVVTKLTSKHPISSRKELKEKISSIAAVAYIDLQNADSEGYVRFKSAEGATTAISSLQSVLPDVVLEAVTGDEEQKYWEKLLADRELKLHSKDKTNKSKRGLKKVLEKVERNAKNSSHVRFDED